jgi:hypothetical protein
MDIINWYIHRFKYFYWEAFDKSTYVELEFSSTLEEYFRGWTHIDINMFINEALKEYLNENK